MARGRAGHHKDSKELAALIAETSVWCGEKDPEKLATECTLWELKEIAEALGIYDDDEDQRLLPYE